MGFSSDGGRGSFYRYTAGVRYEQMPLPVAFLNLSRAAPSFKTPYLTPALCHRMRLLRLRSARAYTRWRLHSAATSGGRARLPAAAAHFCATANFAPRLSRRQRLRAQAQTLLRTQRSLEGGRRRARVWRLSLFSRHGCVAAADGGRHSAPPTTTHTPQTFCGLCDGRYAVLRLHLLLSGRPYAPQSFRERA